MKSVPVIILSSAVVLIAGCGPCRRIAEQAAEERDSVRVETRYEYRERIDTVYVELPVYIERRIVHDTMSVIENDYARSTAIIRPDGDLYHDLETKPTKHPVAVTTKESVRDSIVYRDREVEKSVVVTREKEPTRWQRGQMTGFWVLLGLIIAVVAVKVAVRLKK